MANLKDQNKYWLAGLMGAPLLLILILQVGLQSTKSLFDFGVAAGLALVATGVLVMLADVLPQSLKHKLVFLRFRNELPGHRCDKLCFADPRLGREALVNGWPNVFGPEVATADRNQLWYRHIYTPVKNEPQVQSAHQKFLLYRDASAGTLLIMLLLVAWHLAKLDIPNLGTLHPWAISIEACFFLAMLVSARNHGKRMVVNATVVQVSGN